MNKEKLHAELKQLYAILEAPDDDGYNEEICEEINQIISLIKNYERKSTNQT